MILLIIFLGLWLGISLKTSLIVLLIVSIIAFIFLLVRFKKKFALIFLASVALGGAISLIKIDQNKNCYTGVVIESKENYYILSNGLERLHISLFDNPYEVGDILKLEGQKIRYNFPCLESDFDFNEHLQNKGVYYSFDVKNTKVIIKNIIRSRKLKHNFINKFNGHTRNFVGSLYFGSGFNDHLTTTLRGLHLYRLASLSGLSVYAILHFISYLLSLKFDEEKSKKLAYLILAPYLIFVIGKFAIFKLVILFIMRLVNKRFFHDKFDYLSLLGIFGISCLIFDYHLAYQQSFILSFLMTLILYLFNNSFKFIKSRKRRLLSLGFIFLFFIPFETNFYHEISILSPLFQMILSPFIIVISFFTMLCFYHIPLYSLVDGLVHGFEVVVNFIKPLFISVYCAPFPMWFSLIYELVLLTGTYFLSIRFKPFYKICIAAISLFGLYFIPIKPYGETYIAFLNIGQGDSTFIHYKDLDILVDTGGNLHKDIAKSCLIPFFKKQQIYSLDYLITTHDDFDHIGARDSLMENFRVKNYYNTIDKFPLVYKDFVMENLNIYSTDSPDENENSLVLKFKLKDTDILIMGDAPKIIENQIINDHPDLRCDILKVGHHGSNTSSSLRFVKTVDPDVAIISCGKHNKYGHPHDEVLSVLNYLDIEIRRTDIESTIYYYF